jgi:hypothetical protein
VADAVPHRVRFARPVLLLSLCVVASGGVDAQRGGAPPQTPRESAAIDLTGYWVSVITEDWKFRMVTPRKGVFDSLNLNAEGRKVGEAWDPARDEAAGEQCRAYTAANVMRIPGRLRVAWQGDSALRIETDAGTQTRLLQFAAAAPAAARADAPTWQGQSVAQWQYASTPRGAPRRGNLKVVTTNLRAGYVRKNGAPHSEKAVVTEYYDLNAAPNGDQWMTITTKVEDPVYFTRPYITTTDFKKLPGADGWNPTPCSAR